MRHREIPGEQKLLLSRSRTASIMQPGATARGQNAFYLFLVMQAAVCNATVEDGVNNIIDLLKEEGCAGRLAFLCAATGIAAKAAVREGLKFFKVNPSLKRTELSCSPCLPLS